MRKVCSLVGPRVRICVDPWIQLECLLWRKYGMPVAGEVGCTHQNNEDHNDGCTHDPGRYPSFGWEVDHFQCALYRASINTLVATCAFIRPDRLDLVNQDTCGANLCTFRTIDTGIQIALDFVR